ncbi:putative Acetylgalactosaminyl-O-glycosyl-glycoprotein beta-1,3-N-acetylglucosaminyltransferase [Hypsibius exemplaris]|uniref:Hexosyltransferase n=1 Tax=Hypsibius exemplaris TaxID=2072580 RepID=A0A9X6NPQ4_HYPEX|nr:putative Acetylgalactosaminyl-O-glycosyl-glycoprotein beta-1,3-N-acetylglucosaminyltransferase [Hypsibius exemplaris]
MHRPQKNSQVKLFQCASKYHRDFIISTTKSTLISMREQPPRAHPAIRIIRNRRSILSCFILLACLIILLSLRNTDSQQINQAPELNESRSFLQIFHSARKNLRKFDFGAELVYAVRAEQINRQYIIQPSACTAHIRVVMVIHSKPSNFEKRQTIRRTWGSLLTEECGLKRIFVFGTLTAIEIDLQTALELEAELHGDLLQTSNDDNYRVSALNSLHAFQWVAGNCPDSLYTSKADDDVWISIPKYYKFLVEHFNSSSQVFGLQVGGGTVLRSPDSKYYVPREEFAGDKYPTYISGTLVSFPTNLLSRLLHVSKTFESVMFLDDAFVYGVLLHRANVTIAWMPDIAITLKDDSTKCVKRDVTAVHYVQPDKMVQLWKDPWEDGRSVSVGDGWPHWETVGLSGRRSVGLSGRRLASLGDGRSQWETVGRSPWETVCPTSGKRVTVYPGSG